MTHGKVGAVLVVGAGVAGLQATLDLARAGFKVYLAEAGPAVGGRMPALGRVFPTNECSLCTLSPQLAAVARHPNVKTITQARLVNLEGEAGRFRATLAVTPRGVDHVRCKVCGACSAVCPVSVPDQFNAGLSRRKAIYQPYPQAQPAAYVIDRAACNDCGRCVEVCTAHAVDLERDEDERMTLEVGAVILSPGLAPFDPSTLGYLGYGRYRNVITSVTFERILSSGGPSGGRLVRPSDGRAPERIAWLQCIGSRNPAIGRGYCSAVCCMAAVKAAVSAREQAVGPLETVIFYRDLRAYGKGHERYLARARSAGVRFVRAGVGGLDEDDEGRLVIRYATEDGTVRRERFDLVVLSVGQEAACGYRELARAAGVAVDEFGFCVTSDVAGNCTSRPGVFVAGSFAGPRDIPDSVTGGSAAASQVMAFLAGSRGTLVERPVTPPERDVTEQEPRIGVVVCRCGTNIAGTVDVARVAAAARGLPGVIWVREQIHACAADGQAVLRRAIERHGLNRVVIAACSPRTHGLLFGSVVREAGLNRYLVEMANIRDHCAWVHSDAPEEATAKACALVRGAVAKARALEPVADVSVRLIPAALVVGGGVAGLEAAFGLAEQGFEVHLVDRASTLGGRAAALRYEPEGRDLRGYVAGLIGRVMEHPLIHVHLERTVSQVQGHVGRFVSVLDDGQEIRHGVAVLATGAAEGGTDEYLHGQHPAVYTQGAFEAALDALDTVATAVFIQCVGSRREGARRPYCSRMCCARTLALALATLDRHPEARVYVLYRDLTVYGRVEEVYREARRRGVVFVRYSLDDPPVAADSGKKVAVRIRDAVLGNKLEILSDVLVLATGLEPAPGNRDIARLFKVPVDDHGFFLEAQPMLRPVDFAAEGLFLCGDAQAPKALHESAAQGRAAAARAGALLGAGSMEARGVYAVVDPESCAACLNCVRVCPYNVPVLEGRTARIEPVACQGCGICVAGCPNQAISLTGYNRGQLTALLGALFADPKDGGREHE